MNDTTIDMSMMHCFKGVWALSRLKPETGRLHAEFYAWPVIYGRDPIWVVYNKQGKFIRYAGGRHIIERWYPGYTWRRAMCRWSIVDTDNHPADKRGEEMKALTGKAPPKRNKELKK